MSDYSYFETDDENFVGYNELLDSVSPEKNEEKFIPEDHVFALGAIISSNFAQWHNKQFIPTKTGNIYVGDSVRLIVEKPFAKKGIYQVTGINHIEDNMWELSLAEIPFLFYNYEVEKL